MKRKPSISTTTHQEILHLAIPNILSNLTVPLLSVVDTAIMGHLEDPTYLGAIALGGVIFNMIYWSFGFLRMGTTGLTAQAFGQQDKQKSGLVLAQALLVAILGGLSIWCCQVPIEWMSFWLLEGSAATEALAREYFYIRVWAAPATIAVYAFHGWFLGMQNAIYPMAITILINVVNIALNFLFVYYFGMTSDGVAWATVIAQYIGCGLAIFLLLHKYTLVLQTINRTLVLQWEGFQRFFTVNRDIFIRTLCLLFAFAFFTAKSAETSDVILSVNQILLQYLFIMAYGVDGFAFAAESLVGKYMGAKNKQGLTSSIRYSFYWGMGLALLFVLGFAMGGPYLLNIFSNNQTVLETAQPFLCWVILLPLVSAPAYIWDGVYIGATASVAMRNAMLAATFLVYLPVYYVLEPVLGNHALWLAMVLFMLARALLLWALAKKSISI